MYIVEAFCALAIACLCTDVEAKWWIYRADASSAFAFTKRTYSYPEQLLFKVTCVSNCKIGYIQVDGLKKGGNFLLNAYSATAFFCYDVRDFCLGPQLKEKEFFIEVKPNPSFTNGLLTVKLNQKGMIYELRHEGARYHHENAVVIYSGYHPVKLPNLLSQFMITCKGNCEDIMIYARGRNFMVVASDGPIILRKSKCHYCFCRSGNHAYVKDCKSGSTRKFNLQSDRFYVTLVPDPEAKDVYATVVGSYLKAVTKFNPNTQWYIRRSDTWSAFAFTKRTYSYPEALLFKVKCASNCTIKDILVNGLKDGKFLLSAESATTNICSGQSKRCLGTKQIDEKEFFIEVKPNPSFANGQLTVKLNQAGMIYELRHEGARFHNAYYVQVFSGYHPVKSNRLPQYKFTCKTKCKDITINATGRNFMIVASEEPILLRKSGCHYCFCGSSNHDYVKHCISGSTKKFNLRSYSFYVTFVPDLEVKDVQATVIGSYFKGVTKFNPKHNNMFHTSRYIGRSDALDDYTFASRRYKYPEKKLFIVICDSNCTIRDIIVNGVKDGGKFLLSAESATTNICSGQSRRCLATKQIDETEFFIEVKPNPSFSNGILTVQLDQTGTIYELRHEGAWFKHPNTVVINSGYLPVKLPDPLSQYKITCNGNCHLQKISGSGDIFKVAVSKVPALLKKGGCYNCLCVSSKECSWFNFNSDSFYVAFPPGVKDAQAKVMLSNFKAVTKINLNTKHISKDDKGNPAEVYFVNGPIQSELTLEFNVYYDYYFPESDFHIDVLTDATVKEVLATKPEDSSFKFNKAGRCTNCRCTSRKSCKTVKAYVDRSYYYNVEDFRVRVVLGPSLSPTYVRVSGIKFRNLGLVKTTG